jgi:hypothetical protein
LPFYEVVSERMINADAVYTKLPLRLSTGTWRGTKTLPLPTLLRLPPWLPLSLSFYERMLALMKGESWSLFTNSIAIEVANLSITRDECVPASNVVTVAAFVGVAVTISIAIEIARGELRRGEHSRGESA